MSVPSSETSNLGMDPAPYFGEGVNQPHQRAKCAVSVHHRQGSGDAGVQGCSVPENVSGFHLAKIQFTMMNSIIYAGQNFQT